MSVFRTALLAGSILGMFSVSGSYAQTMAPDGTFVSGDTYTMAPDGTFVGGSESTMAPDGTWVGSDNGSDW